ncbi:pyridoxal phosphate-dependent aminotransferase [Aestuariimicrobium ganziense]|uniref:pyridoxal phosphate-dependent aminotransferase n=1 Tax=Aestuariimicrobium ganziense TaxID=2773677 RepID=UPI0019456E31|nr:pyridoxal phosphate-dependent aminotransferase [Aestuariimicrobium ganziense]
MTTPSLGHPTLAEFGTTIFAERSALASALDAVNLGQGFPDHDGPAEVLEAARAAIAEGHNQYPPGIGVPALLQAVADHQRDWYGIDLDPTSQVLVTVGATEAIASVVLALLRPGDEVVVFEPYYDSYAATIALAGGDRRTVPLRFPDWAVDEAALRAAFSSRTRMVLLNSPHNPTGKVFTRDELELVARLAREHDALVVTDEVYEHLVFTDSPTPHVPMASLPGMHERTLTIGSAGKTFSVTGWKVGWVSGPADLVAAARAVKQFLTYVGSGPFQHATATGLGLPRPVFDRIAADLQAQRDRLCVGLTSMGLPISRPDGGYFVIADLADWGVDDALAWCRALPERAGVAAIPVSVFSDDKESVRSLVRFAHCKRPEVLDEGLRRLAKAR